MWKIKITLLFIVLLAAVLRLSYLDTNPPALSWDEVAWGYNAYALGIDGRDEFGRYLPLDYLESYGDFKPPMYAYLDIIPVKLWGLTPFAVRFPSALFGIVTVLLTFFLARAIFSSSPRNNLYALSASFFLAISPWHIMLSRAAFEANVASFFLCFGVFLFLQGIEKKPWLLTISAVSFVFSMYTFNTSRIVAPLLVLMLILLYNKTLLKFKKPLIIAAIIGGLILLPTVKFLVSPQASLRFKEVNIFSNLDVIERSNQQIANDNNNILSKFIHNRRVLYSGEYIKHYFDNLSFSFLFINGDKNPRFSTQDVGELYLWELPFFIGGLFLLFKKKESKWWLIPVWILMGIIPAATARETPHALRIETTLPMFQLLTAYGVVNFWLFSQEKIKDSLVRKGVVGISVLLLILNIAYFQIGYYREYPREYSSEWQYGYKQAFAYVTQNQDRYKHVYFTTELGRPYIYYLFFNKNNPSWFRKNSIVNRDAFGFVSVEKVENIFFTKDMSGVKDKDTLLIDIPGRVPQEAKVLYTVKLLNGVTTLIAYTL